MLTETIARWQQEALQVRPPKGNGHLPALGGLPGPAFFPEGLGLSEPIHRENDTPTIVAIGHNFGCEAYRTEIDPAGREDDKATWRNLDSLLLGAGLEPVICYRTNWFIGLLPGNTQTGVFLHGSDPNYERVCLSLLSKQLEFFQPSAILLLGFDVVRRAYQLAPALDPWRNSKNWKQVDCSSIGHSPRNVHIPEAKLKTNIVALLHPSFAPANQGRRMKNMPVPMSQSEMIRAAACLGPLAH